MRAVFERHRHRYEFNNTYRDRYTQAGFRFSGLSKDDLVEIIELPGHPWFVATQFHPEFTSTPRDGHPLFTGFVRPRASIATRSCRKWRAPDVVGRARIATPSVVAGRRRRRHADLGSLARPVPVDPRLAHVKFAPPFIWPAQLVEAFVFGLAYAFMFQRTGSLLGCSLAHGFSNTIYVAMLLIKYSN